MHFAFGGVVMRQSYPFAYRFRKFSVGSATWNGGKF